MPMKNRIKNGVVWITIWLSPIASFAENTLWNSEDFSTQTKIELSNTLNYDMDYNIESINKKISAKILTDAALSYIDEEVKAYKLKPESREKLSTVLNSYFSSNCILEMWDDGRLIFKIDDKKAFIKVAKDVVNIVLDNMPFLVRKVWVVLFFGGENSLQKKLDNLDSTMRNMKSKEYKNIIFDYVAWIIKRVAKKVNWNMVVDEYYNGISKQFPNKKGNQILLELNNSWQSKSDIKNFKYPFK